MTVEEDKLARSHKRKEHTKGKRTVAAYCVAIWKLKAKREQIRLQVMQETGWNGIFSKIIPPIYKERTKLLSTKIHKYTRRSKILALKNRNIPELIAKVQDFIGVKLQAEYISRKKPTIQHGIYMKYGIEHGYNGTRMAEKIGMKKTVCHISPYMVRKYFTKSFETNSENKELYHRFVRFMQEESD